MAADYILTTGHFILITMNPPETYPTLTAPIPLVGSCRDMKISGLPVCLEGDEMPPMLRAPHPYMSPTFNTTPGMGMVTVKIQSSNKTSKAKNGGKAILISGQTFQVDFNVTVPANLVTPPAPPVPDSVMKKSGTARFINLNVRAKAD